jgi:cell division protein FtsB
VKKYLGSPVDVDVDRLKMEFEKLKDENIKLKREVQELKSQVLKSIVYNSWPKFNRINSD